MHPVPLVKSSLGSTYKERRNQTSLHDNMSDHGLRYTLAIEPLNSKTIQISKYFKENV